MACTCCDGCCTPPAGRSEIIDEGQPFSVVVDAAHTPEALSTLLSSLREAGAKRIFTVFGCPGDERKDLRPYMGEVGAPALLTHICFCCCIALA